VNCLLIASPLVRDSDSATGSIADAIVQQEAAQAEIEEVLLETTEKVEVDIIETDLPELPDAPMVDPGGSDLPE